MVANSSRHDITNVLQTSYDMDERDLDALKADGITTRPGKVTAPFSQIADSLTAASWAALRSLQEGPERAAAGRPAGGSLCKLANPAMYCRLAPWQHAGFEMGVHARGAINFGLPAATFIFY